MDSSLGMGVSDEQSLGWKRAPVNAGVETDEVQVIASILTEHSQELVRRARRWVDSEVAAEDVVQDVTVAAMTRQTRV